MHCPHFPSCSGCSVDLSVSPPPLWNEIVSYFKGTPQPVLIEGSPVHWRCRAKLAVRGTLTNPLIGLFKQNSHEVMSIPSCFVHHPHINNVVNVIKSQMKLAGLVPYDEKTGTGDLRYLQCVVQRGTGRIQLALVLNCLGMDDSAAQRAMRLTELLYEACCKEQIHSLWFNFNPKLTNTIFGEAWSLVSGEEFLMETFGHLNVYYHPANFGQANLNLFERMLHRIEDWIPIGSRVVEYYAGIGVIGLFVASKCQWVRCEEINPFAEKSFNRSLSKNSDLAEKVRFEVGKAEKFWHWLDEATVAIVDPPRKGLDEKMMNALNASSLKELIYISCGWDSFKRDHQELACGGWVLVDVEAYLFFPGSNHIEILSRFVNNS